MGARVSPYRTPAPPRAGPEPPPRGRWVVLAMLALAALVTAARIDREDCSTVEYIYTVKRTGSRMRLSRKIRHAIWAVIATREYFAETA